jgi:N-acetylneuraminic acid mutarotase
MMRTAQLQVVVLLGACGDDAMSTIDASTTTDVSSPPGWSTGAPVGHGALQETASAAVAGKIYVVGGFDGDEGIVARVQVYDTATNTWSDGPNLPRALHHATVTGDGTTIYVLGALATTGFTAIGDVYSLAPQTEITWTTRMAMPAGRERGAAVADFIDDKIYVAGGFRNGAASDMVDVYDPMMNTWGAPLMPLPATRDHACGATIGGELIVAGGRTAQITTPQPDTWSYAPGANTWTPRAPMPTGRGGTGCGAITGTLYVAGGEGNSGSPIGIFNQVEGFAAGTNTWSQLAAMPNPKHGVGGAVWNGALYLCGGADRAGFGAIATTDIFRP